MPRNRNHIQISAWLYALCAALGAPFGACAAQQPSSSLAALFDENRPLATSGLSTLDGSSGGGLASWATIGGYGSDKGLGTAFHYTYLNVTNYQDQNVGMLLGLFNRVEISYTHNFLQTGSSGRKLGIGNDYMFDLDNFGIKGRLFGNITDAGLIPQVAVGMMYKHARDAHVIDTVGGKSTQGADFYVAATKIFGKAHIVLDTTVRFTRSNQVGLLGFGGDRDNSYHPQFEGSLGYLPPFIPRLVVGVEFRTKPKTLFFSPENNWFDAYASYFFNKHLNLTLAYVSLGTIANFRNQTGVYASLQTGF